MALMVTLMNLIGSYLRYLPFSQILSRSLTIKLWSRLITWSIFSLIILILAFKTFDVNVFVYKLILYLIWLPYLVISIIVIKNKISPAEKCIPRCISRFFITVPPILVPKIITNASLTSERLPRVISA